MRHRRGYERRRRSTARNAAAALVSITVHLAALALAARLVGQTPAAAAFEPTAGRLLTVSLSPGAAPGQEARDAAPKRPPREPPAERTTPEPIPSTPVPAMTANELTAEPAEPTSSDATTEAAGESGAVAAQVGSIGAANDGAVGGEAERAVREGAVMARIQAAKTYPDAARRRGIEGAVVVVFAIAADGSLLRVEAEPGGAHPLLVRAAVAAISEAAPYPPGGGAETSYRVTLVYRLER